LCIIVQQVSAVRAVAAIKKQHEKEIAAKERQRVADEKHRKNEMA